MIEGTSEIELLRAVVPELEAEGFEVFLQPSGSFLPAFLQEIRPDAIALSEKKNLAIEIARDTSQARQHLQQLSTQIKGQPKWELRVFWVNPATSRAVLAVQPAATLKERIDEARKLLAGGHYGSALLIGWATFEAICRALMPTSFEQPQTPRRLVEVISSEGYVTPDQADQLRFLAQLRNGFIHGNLDIPMDKDEIGSFIELLSKLEMEVEEAPQLNS